MRQLRVLIIGFIGCASAAGCQDGSGDRDRGFSRQRAPLASPLFCNSDPPEGAPMPDPLPVYQGTCPQLSPYPTENVILSSGDQRRFLLAVPAGLSPDETLPVLFLWHWLGGSPGSFYSRGEIQAAVDSQRFLAVMPFKKGDVYWHWPVSIVDSDSRMEREYAFFDDMLACIAAQFPNVNPSCVASAGVSAGALFTDQLGHARANRLSSIVSLSGGVGGLIRNWGNPAHKLPALVLWGGPMDSCVLSFEAMSLNLEQALANQGNFMVECIHNCAHSQPPVDPPPGVSKYEPLWQFVFDHPFWLAAGDSPYVGGLPSSFPEWCGVAAGSAVPRTGPCGGTECHP